MTLMNYAITILFGICTTVLAVIALVQRHKFNEYQKRVFVEQGTFKKPAINISLFGQDDIINAFIIAAPFEEKTIIWEIPLPIKITNVGDKTAKNIELLYRINKELCYGGQTPAPIIKKSGFKNAKVAQSKEDGPFISVIISLNDIHPGQSVVFPLRLSIRSDTIFPHDVNVTTKDGVNLIVKTWLNIAYPFDCVVCQEDYRPVNKRFSLQVIDISEETPEQFFSRYNKVLFKNYEEKMSKMSFIQKTKQYFQRKDAVQNIGMIVVDKKSIQKELKIEGEKKRICVISDNGLRIYSGIEWSHGYVFLPGFTLKDNRTDKNIAQQGKSADVL